MTEFQEFPKMLYHPKTNDQVIVRSADEESAQLEAWGVSDAPLIPLISSGEGGASKPKAAPKAGASKPKAS